MEQATTPDPAPPAANQRPLEILLASPRGFCAGVDRAIQIVETALQRFGAPIYVRHAIVHNHHVVAALEAKGAIFVDELDEVPANGRVVFSAHGVPKSVPEDAQRRNLQFLDATCPLVSKVHREAERHHRQQRHILLIGHAGHPEVIGTMGQLPSGVMTLIENAAQAHTITPPTPDALAPDGLAYVTQTTLSVDDTAEIVDILQRRFPSIHGPKQADICYATTNRQAAVKAIAPQCEALIVVGSPNSSNSNRLVEVARLNGCPDAFLVEGAADVDWQRLRGLVRIGITAGASAPEILVDELISASRRHFDVTVRPVAVATENISFKLPRELVT